jgi:hypothetical protein
MENLKKQEVQKLVRALVSWTVRGLVVGGIGAGRTEDAYAKAAVRVRKGEATTAGQLFQELAEIVPTDEAFQAAFATVRVSSAKLARYYLLALENWGRGEKEPELVANSREDEVNLEHVLPQNPKTGKWGAFEGESVKEWAQRLGNMVLLAKSQNAKLGNKDFADKAAVYKASELKLTSAVGGESTWDKERITKRQTALAKDAVTVWPRKP